jgi:hypothetical protein
MYGMIRVMAKLDNMMFNISIDGKRKRILYVILAGWEFS